MLDEKIKAQLADKITQELNAIDAIEEQEKENKKEARRLSDEKSDHKAVIRFCQQSINQGFVQGELFDDVK